MMNQGSLWLYFIMGLFKHAICSEQPWTTYETIQTCNLTNSWLIRCWPSQLDNDQFELLESIKMKRKGKCDIQGCFLCWPCHNAFRSPDKAIRPWTQFFFNPFTMTSSGTKTQKYTEAYHHHRCKVQISIIF
jgi:hypothetical protein